MSSPTTTTIHELFQKRSIKDIRAIYERTRDECQAKQNDLKSLVGERYHDLIDATDSIMHISELCNSCTSKLSSVSQGVRLISERPAVPQDQPHLQQQQQSTDAIAIARVKKILDLCNLMFVCSKNGYNFDFSLCYMMLHRLYSNLSDAQKRQYMFLESKISLIEAEKNKMTQSCTNHIQQLNLTDVDYTQSLCTLLILGHFDSINSNISEDTQTSNTVCEHLLNHFLESREHLMTHILKGLNDGSQIENASKILNVLYSTLVLIHIMFDAEISGCGTMQQMMTSPAILKNKMFKTDAEKRLYMNLYHQLFEQLFSNLKSQEVSVFSFDTSLTIPTGRIIQLRDKWMERIVPIVKQTMHTVTDRIENAAQLVELEDVAYKFAFQYSEIAEQLFKSNTAHTIKNIFQNTVLSTMKTNIWDQLQNMFMNREKKIIQFKLSTVFLVLEKKRESGGNIGEKLWTNLILSDDDMVNRYYQRIKLESFISNPYNQFHTQATESFEVTQKNNFSLDIFIGGITDRVKHVVSVDLYEKQLKPILEDLFIFVMRERSRTVGKLSEEKLNALPLSLDEQEGEIERALYSNLFSSIERICNNIENDIDNSKDIDHMLFLAQICLSIKGTINEITNELLTHAGESAGTDINRIRLVRSASSTVLPKKRQRWIRLQKKSDQQQSEYEDPLFKLFELEQTLDNLYASAHKLWINRMSQLFVDAISQQVEKEDWKDMSRKDMWQEVIVPSEEHSADEDRILLPFHPSYCIHNALHDINTSLYSIGAFEVQKPVLRDLSYELGSKVFNFYKLFLNSLLEKQASMNEKEKKQEINKQDIIKQDTSEISGEDNPVVPQEEQHTTNGDHETENTDEKQDRQDNNDNNSPQNGKSEADELDILSDDSEHDDDSKNNAPQSKLISEEGYLQLLFDIRFLGDVLIGTPFDKLQLKQQTAESLTQLESQYVSLVELILNQIDPINWEIYEKVFISLVNDCVIRNKLFVPMGISRQYTMKKRILDSSVQLGHQDDSFLKLCNSGSHFNLLPIPRRETRPTYANVLQDEASSAKNTSPSKQQKPSSANTETKPQAHAGGRIYNFVGSLMGGTQNDDSKSKQSSGWGFGGLFAQ